MNKLCVIIDNGHGEETPGKRSPDGMLREYAWNREFAKLLSNKLTSLGIMNEILVPEKEDISLRERCSREKAIVKKYRALGYETLLISIHINASSGNSWSNASGFTAYVYTNGSTKSKSFGKIISVLAKERGLKGNRYIPATQYHEANFYILKNSASPAVLTENFFMTNREDVKFLMSQEGKEKLLKLHIDSILEYIATYNYTK